AELRDEAVGALCLPDIEEGPAWETACPGAALAFADDPMTYAQADGRGTVYFCRAVDGREQRLAEWPGLGYPPKGVNWLSGDGRFLVASASPQGGPLWLWRRDGDRVSLVAEFKAGLAGSALQFSPDSRRLAVGHPDGHLAVYDTATGGSVLWANL